MCLSGFHKAWLVYTKKQYFQIKHWYYLVGIPTLTNMIRYQFYTVTSGLKLGDIFPLASVILYFHYLFSHCRIHHFDDKFVHYHYMITLQNIHSRWMHSTIRDILLKMITNCNHNTGPPVDYYMTSFEGSIWAIRGRKSKKDNTIECSVD